MPRSRLRTFTLWTGTLLSLLIVAAFVVSAWWQIVIQVPTSRGPALSLAAGEVMIMTYRLKSDTVSAKVRNFDLSRWNSWMAPRPVRFGGLTTGFPLWLPFLIVLLPTLLVWWLGRKRLKPGHCECGYDLRGNESGKCPECGRAALPYRGSEIP